MNKKDGCIIEFYQLGGSIKVSAIDPVTMKEVSIVGDAKATKEQLTELAIKKLKYVLAKN